MFVDRGGPPKAEVIDLNPVGCTNFSPYIPIVTELRS